MCEDKVDMTTTGRLTKRCKIVVFVELLAVSKGHKYALCHFLQCLKAKRGQGLLLLLPAQYCNNAIICDAPYEKVLLTIRLGIISHVTKREC